MKAKKMEPIIGIDEEAKPDEEPERSNATAQAISEVPTWSKATATDNQVRIAYWRQPMSEAVIHDKNSGKIHFARCFLECIKAIHGIRAKKMEPIIGIDEEGEARRRAGAE